jgi:phage host-nuclease inhibitor protein Gam
MKTEHNQTDAIFSPRSQRSLAEQLKLEDQVKRLESKMRGAQRNIDELEKSRAAHLRLTAEGKSGFAFFERLVSDLQEKVLALAEYKKHRDALQLKAHELAKVGPAKAAERKKKQTRLAEAAGERLEKDRLIEAAVKELHRLLRERAQLTGLMSDTATALEFTVDGPDGLDEQRFSALRDSLPNEVAPMSEQWFAWFLGNQENLKVYVVRDECLILPETLANAGFYRRGEKVMLTDKQAVEFLRADRPVDDRSAPWRRFPPRVMTVKDFESAVAAAEEKRVSLAEFFRNEDLARDEKAEAAYRGAFIHS